MYTMRESAQHLQVVPGGESISEVERKAVLKLSLRGVDLFVRMVRHDVTRAQKLQLFDELFAVYEELDNWAGKWEFDEHGSKTNVP